MKTVDFTHSVDSDELAHNELSHLDLYICPLFLELSISYSLYSLNFKYDIAMLKYF